jgi:hypothetical protein
MFCPQCGKSNEDSSKFCQSCGAAVDPGNAASTGRQEDKAKPFTSDSFLFNFIAPCLACIDNGNMFRRPFQWLYVIIAALNIIWPFYLVYVAITANIFQLPFKYVLAFIVAWLPMVFGAWIGFQIWWNRSKKVVQTSTEGDEFFATPVFSHFIQTLGEWAGIWIGLIGPVVALLAKLMLGDESSSLLSLVGLGFVGSGIIGIILLPLYGYLILTFARFLAETWRALVAIANNTKK